MKRTPLHFGALIAMPLMVLLPLLGMWLTGRLAPHHFEFPPLTRYVEHAPFNWLAFVLMATSIVACCLPVVVRMCRRTASNSPQSTVHSPLSTFPLWGWLGIAFTIITWVIAWNRFSWAASIRYHTFFPLWLGYIVVISALTQQRKGSCLLTAQPLRIAVLFAVSAIFWWYFEYLNRFVQNWFYFGVDSFSAPRYFAFATPPFATVLPAVMGTAEWLETFPRFNSGLQDWHPVPLCKPRRFAAAWLCAGTLSLSAIGLVPDLLFPMLWLSPLILITAIQALTGSTTVFSPLRTGNWQRIVRLAVAGLICGFFWEMWNCRSAAGWIYAVPFVGRFKIFEMPILGYAGYLPFGLECAVISDLVLRQKGD